MIREQGHYGSRIQRGFGFGSRLQRGEGIGGIFSKFISFLKPAAKSLGSVIKKAVTSEPVKSFAKEAVKTSVDVGTNVLGDIILGNDPKESAAKELQRVRENVGTAVKSIKGDFIAPSTVKTKKRKATKSNRGRPKKNRTLLDT